MKIAKYIVLVAMFCSITLVEARARATAAEQVTALLHEFMEAAGRGDQAVFDRFFAEDVIYTRATGVVLTKADIMDSVRKSTTPREGKSTYAAEDLTVHEYGDTVVVAFRLVGRMEDRDGKVETSLYRNTGTFLKRDGRWQAVAWQATKISEAVKIP